MKKLHRGNWADNLERGQKLPIGGSIFADELTNKLILDFENFSRENGPLYSSEEIKEGYNKKRSQIEEVLYNNVSEKGLENEIDSYLYYAASVVQQKVRSLLEINPDKNPSDFDRLNKFWDNGNESLAYLSDMKGNAACAEQSALAQHLLQYDLGDSYSSSYVGGITQLGDGSHTENHSFLVLRNNNNKSYIFDVSMPYNHPSIPRILKPDTEMNYQLLEDKTNFLVGATDILKGSRRYYGVGNPFFSEEPKYFEQTNLDE